ncbi:transient receptor potential protein [Condylostylus longicornis]|uniref:transient receptor potential protein n=1 Tax=Condylostylus longicornis TaxID=2530218 RepID=UPI00244DF0EB|nr:transient receptor potential protein [Condylostylus longicornis]
MKSESKESLVEKEKERSRKQEEDEEAAIENLNIHAQDEYILSEVEKAFILAAEKGDCARVKKIIDEFKDKPTEFNINCVDPLNRSALISAIENENEDLITLLLEEGINVGDALLHAISEEYVEAVEELLQWEEKTHEEGKPYSWEAVDRSKSNFTPDITPLILAAHRNNYEILKILLDRGASVPMPHDIKCGCDTCIASSQSDSLRYSQSRINAYKALSASSLIALSSKDPVLTAFELSCELKHLQTVESEFRAEYAEMRADVQEFVTSLLDHARTSSELEVMLNFNHEASTDVWMPGQRQTLERLKLAIKYKQKNFVAHPNVQQLLAAIWYDGLPGFRRKKTLQQITQVMQLGCSFPIYSLTYLIAPGSEKGLLMRKPFVKFIMHSTSYMFFLALLGASSLRMIPIMFELMGFPWMLSILEDWKKHERGSLPGPIELAIIMYITSLIFGELKTLYNEGLLEYICDLWNIVDFISNTFYVTWILMRITSWVISHRDLWYRNINPYFPREHWHPFDPMLIAEGAFAAGMIFSFLKLVHIFSINPHLGPLQVSLGRMIIDIIKFFFIYTLVLFAFGCGLNQLLWYYADLEKRKCYHLHPDVPDFDDQEKACTIWRRFANLFETSQSLFWASFGLVDLVSFDLAGIKGFTRFWALLLFGSYSVINIIVLLNMLIAMMSNSYQVIYEKADVEWKFARSQLWMSYFEDGSTLPPPFNMCPSMKLIRKTLGKQKKRTRSVLRRALERAQRLHEKVMKHLVRRYVIAMQRKRDDYGITEDDIIEVRADISSFRYELLDILEQNRFDIPDIDRKRDTGATNKKGRVLERRIKKDFQIGIVETIATQMEKDNSKDIFSTIAKVVGRNKNEKASKDWNAIVRQNTISSNPIGSTKSSMIRRSQRSLRRKILTEANAGLAMDTDTLVEFNPRLSQVTPTTRVAYVKFMKKTLTKREELEDIKDEGDENNAGVSSDPKPPAPKPELSKALSMSSVKKELIKQNTLKSQKSAEKSTDVLKNAPEAPKTSEPTEKGKAPSPPNRKKGDAPNAPQKPSSQNKPDEKSASNPGGNQKSEPPKNSDKPSENTAKKTTEVGSSKSENKPLQKQTEKGGENSKGDKQEGADKKGDTKLDDKITKANDQPKSGTESAKTSSDKQSEQKSSKSESAQGGSTTTSTTSSSKPPAPSASTKPVTKINIGESTAGAGASGDRGKSTVTGKMISGWL